MCLPDGSRVRREPHARFCERLAVQLRRPTRPYGFRPGRSQHQALDAFRDQRFPGSIHLWDRSDERPVPINIVLVSKARMEVFYRRPQFGQVQPSDRCERTQNRSSPSHLWGGPYEKLIPMQPKPMAETSKLLFPSFRFCIFASPVVTSAHCHAADDDFDVSTVLAQCGRLHAFSARTDGMG